MLMARLERIDGEYVLRIPKHEVVQHDLREGQILAVIVESLDNFGTIGVEAPEHPAEIWKLNEPRQRYEPGE